MRQNFAVIAGLFQEILTKYGVKSIVSGHWGTLKTLPRACPYLIPKGHKRTHVTLAPGSGAGYILFFDTLVNSLRSDKRGIKK